MAIPVSVVKAVVVEKDGEYGKNTGSGWSIRGKPSPRCWAGHPHYKFYANHFLADSPKTMADKHDYPPPDHEFFMALSGPSYLPSR